MVIINCDMGEAFGLYKMGDDEGLMPQIDVANVACGFHGSDFNHMRKTVRLAKAAWRQGRRPSLAARFARLRPPGDEDRPRRADELPPLPDRRAQGVPGCRRRGPQSYQAARRALWHGRADGGHRRGRGGRGRCLQGAAVRHERDAAREGLSARAVIPSSPNTTPISTTMPRAASSSRANMTPRIQPTRQHGACEPSTKARRALSAETTSPSASDSICVHSDTPNAVAIAQAVREAVRPYLAAR